jgi:hypothetical protein
VGKLSSYVFAVFDAEDNGCIKKRWGQGSFAPNSDMKVKCSQ